MYCSKMETMRKMNVKKTRGRNVEENACTHMLRCRHSDSNIHRMKTHQRCGHCRKEERRDEEIKMEERIKKERRHGIRPQIFRICTIEVERTHLSP